MHLNVKRLLYGTDQKWTQLEGWVCNRLLLFSLDPNAVPQALNAPKQKEFDHEAEIECFSRSNRDGRVHSGQFPKYFPSNLPSENKRNATGRSTNFLFVN